MRQRFSPRRSGRSCRLRLFAGAFVVAGLLASIAGAAAGDLDPSFGAGGIVLTKFGPPSLEWGEAVAVQPDGKLVVGGRRRLDIGPADFALVRYNRDGSLDVDFGSGGKVLTDASGGLRQDGAEAIVLQPNGKIIAAGAALGTGSLDFAVVRYNADGSPDESFGKGGIVLTDLDSDSFDWARGVAVSQEGKIVVVGSSDDRRFALVRYNADGTLDASFGNGGIVLTDFFSYAAGWYDVAFQKHGRIVVAGVAGGAGLDRGDFVLARYANDGTLDESFGTGGLLRTDIGGSYDAASSIALEPNGSILAAGSTNARGAFQFALVRYDRDGVIDSSFGSNGRVLTVFGSPTRHDFATGIDLQNNKKILVGGTADQSAFALARYNTDGTLDERFGAGGKVVTDLGALPSFANDLAFQSKDKVVLVGVCCTFLGDNAHIALARYLTR